NRRLARAEAAAPPRGEAAPGPPLRPSDDGGDLAGELAAAFARMVRTYREHFRMPLPEALDRAGGDCSDVEHALNAPPDQVSWFDLDLIARSDPEKARGRWREVVQAARDEVRSGHRAARALEGFDGACWQRARFLAVRAELADAWRPR